MSARAALTIGLAVIAAPTAAIPPPPPPVDAFYFKVGDFEYSCRLPDPAGPLVGCTMRSDKPWIYVSIYPEATGTRYEIRHICVDKEQGEPFDWAHRNGRIQGGPLRDTAFARDLAELSALPLRPDCAAQYPQQPLDAEFLSRLEHALAILRSL